MVFLDVRDRHSNGSVTRKDGGYRVVRELGIANSGPRPKDQAYLAVTFAEP